MIDNALHDSIILTMLLAYQIMSLTAFSVSELETSTLPIKRFRSLIYYAYFLTPHKTRVEE